MKPTRDTTRSVDDTEENRGQCICTMCPTFKANRLGDYPPGALFCARGRSGRPEKINVARCYCLGCDVFIKHGLIIDRLCVNQ